MEDCEKLLKRNEELKRRNKEAIERLKALIVFWTKYNPVDHQMQVEQFKAVINILQGK